MLGTDGTSRDKRQFIEQHIVLSDGNTMSLGFKEVSSDNAQNLLEKTMDLLHEFNCQTSIVKKMRRPKRIKFLKKYFKN